VAPRESTFLLKNIHRSFIWLISALLLIAMGMAFSFWSYRQIQLASSQRTLSRNVIRAANTFLSELKDAETGQRGYALTGNEAYLQPYFAVHDRLVGDLRALQALSLSDSALDAVTPLLQAQMTGMAQAVALRRNEDLAGLLALVNGGEGKRLMDAIRVEMLGFIQTQDALQLQHDRGFDASMQRMLGIIVSFGVLAIVFSLYFVYANFRGAQQRLKNEVHTETQHLLAAQTHTNLQLQRTNRSLQDSEQKLTVTLNSIGDAVIATDAHARVTLLNPVAQHLTGWTQGEAQGHQLDEVFCIVNKATRQPAHVAVGDVLAFGTIQGLTNHTVLLGRDGREFDIADSCAPIRDTDGLVVGAVLVFRNVTQEYAVQQALRDKNVALEIASALADKANLAKSEFLSNMSHELRSPLNAILGFAQLMDSGTPAPSAAQKASLDQILRAGWYLLELINEILDLALIESGRLSMSIEPISLEEVLLDCQTMIAPQAQKRGIHMQFPAFAEPCFVAADRTRLKQVVVNLLTNAIKYNRAEGAVDVTWRTSTQGKLRVQVRDTGRGLNEKEMSQLFQPFNRLGQEGSAEEGTGIGLVVSKRLVELMGGRIGANSTVGTGSTFWIELQRAQPHATPSPSLQEPVSAPMPLAPLDPVVRTLLYVEDNVANMELVAQLLARRPDIRLLCAADGLRAMVLARTCMPDLILMDINLPGISGLQVLALLKSNGLTKHIPVLALSANAMPRDIEQGMQAGFLRYLTKPIKIGEFMQALDAALAVAPVPPIPPLPPT
jgi:PAS domain S-box-containing protein